MRRSAIEGLLTRLTNDDVEERRDAAAILAEAGAVDPAQVSAALRDPDRQVRKYIALALGRGGNEASKACLIKALRDPAWEVRGYAILGLRSLGARPQLDQIFEQIQDEAHEWVLSCAVDWLLEADYYSATVVRFLNRLLARIQLQPYIAHKVGEALHRATRSSAGNSGSILALVKPDAEPPAGE